MYKTDQMRRVKQLYDKISSIFENLERIQSNHQTNDYLRIATTCQQQQPFQVTI